MTMKLIGLIRIVDATAFDDYRSRVGTTVEKYGGMVVHRGTLAHCYWNELACDAFDTFAELQFPTLDDATRWASSDDYQNLLEVRSQAMKLTLFAVS